MFWRIIPERPDGLHPICPPCNCGPYVDEMIGLMEDADRVVDEHYRRAFDHRRRAGTLEAASRAIVGPVGWRRRYAALGVAMAFAVPAVFLTSSAGLPPGVVTASVVASYYGATVLAHAFELLGRVLRHLAATDPITESRQFLEWLIGFAECDERRHRDPIAAFPGTRMFWFLNARWAGPQFAKMPFPFDTLRT